MNKVVALVKQYPLASFFILTYLLSWWAWPVYVANPNNFPLPLLPAGPMLAALVITAVSDGRSGLKDLLSRSFRWRVNWRWYVVALSLPLVLRLAAFGLNLLLGAPTNFPPIAWAEVLGEVPFLLILIGFGEEVGFRGFALPRLLEGRSALTAALILGFWHTLWHLPLFATGDTAVIIPIIFAGSIFFAWLHQHTNGSVLIAIILHTSVNTMVGFFNPLFTGAYLERQTLLLSIVFVVTAVIIIAVTGINLRQHRTASLTPSTNPY
jgi:membrane protease YdiL (CAAX protease family)